MFNTKNKTETNMKNNKLYQKNNDQVVSDSREAIESDKIKIMERIEEQKRKLSKSSTKPILLELDV